MRMWGQLIGVLALAVFLLPALTAQEEKKDEAKAEKKDDAKKDAEKKDAEKKDSDKSDEKKTEKKTEAKKEVEKVEYGTMLPPSKLLRVADNSAREFAIELKEIDQQKVLQLNIWKAEQMRHIAGAGNNAQERVNRTVNFQRELARRSVDIYSPKSTDLRAADNVKVRTMFLPLQYDDQGNPKKWTPKEINAFRGNSKLPGYPAEMDVLRANQIVQVYLAKPQKSAKTAPVKKKADDDDLPDADSRPEAVMIVVLRDASR